MNVKIDCKERFSNQLINLDPVEWQQISTASEHLRIKLTTFGFQCEIFWDPQGSFDVLLWIFGNFLENFGGFQGLLGNSLDF